MERPKEEDSDKFHISNNSPSENNWKWLTDLLTVIGALLIPFVGYALNKTQKNKIEQKLYERAGKSVQCS